MWWDQLNLSGLFWSVTTDVDIHVGAPALAKIDHSWVTFDGP